MSEFTRWPSGQGNGSDFETYLGLYYFPPEPCPALQVAEELFEATYDKPGVRYFATALNECYDSTAIGWMHLALAADGRAWGLIGSQELMILSGCVAVEAKDAREAADKIAEIFDLENFDIFDPGNAPTRDGPA